MSYLVNPYMVTPTVPYVAECWWVANINGQVSFELTTAVNTVISANVQTTDNLMYDWNSPNVRQVGMYLGANAGLSGGLFRMGVWDSSGNIKVVSAQFTEADLVEAENYSETEEFFMPLSTTTSIAVGDNVGIIMNEACTGSGGEQVIGGGAYPFTPTPTGSWRRHIFIQGSTGDYSTNKTVPVCLST